MRSLQRARARSCVEFQRDMQSVPVASDVVITSVKSLISWVNSVELTKRENDSKRPRTLLTSEMRMLAGTVKLVRPIRRSGSMSRRCPSESTTPRFLDFELVVDVELSVKRKPCFAESSMRGLVKFSHWRRLWRLYSEEPGSGGTTPGGRQ